MLAHQIMTRNVITVTPDMPVIEAAKAMLRHHVAGLPVVDASGCCCGIISQADVALSSTENKAGELVREVSKGGSAGVH